MKELETSDVHQIKSILKEWNKFPANAEADFDCLVSEVVAALEDGFDTFYLAAVIQNEFVNHVGESGPDDDVLQVSEVITDWWGNKQTR